jgi:hypothetical protein
MFNPKVICLGLVLLAVTINSGSPNSHPVGTSLDKRADGTAPPAPPLPWIVPSEGVLRVDGTAPPAPPLPWKKLSISA